jgi:hypothetical protein
LDNLALAATSNRTTVQQLTSANLSLTKSVATLKAVNKKLIEMVRDAAAAGDAVAMAPDVVPQQFGEINVGRMGTRSCILARPTM